MTFRISLLSIILLCTGLPFVVLAAFMSWLAEGRNLSGLYDVRFYLGQFMYTYGTLTLVFLWIGIGLLIWALISTKYKIVVHRRDSE